MIQGATSKTGIVWLVIYSTGLRLSLADAPKSSGGGGGGGGGGGRVQLLDLASGAKLSNTGPGYMLNIFVFFPVTETF